MTLDNSRPDAATESTPFAPASQTARGTVVRWVLIVLGLALAAFAAWWFTRAAPSAAAESAHVHGAASPSDSLGQPVMLSVEDATRIGVTYALVERATLAGDVRTVGLVTIDETRVKTIAPKIDGYVEQLYVAFTGESVQAGVPLLRIYSPMLVTAQEELLLAKKLSADVARAGGTSGDAGRDAESLLASARRRLRYWDIPDEDIARVERTGEVTKTLTLRAPVTGVVVQKNVLAGQRIMAGEALFQVADLREVWVEGEVFEQDLPSVRLGQHVMVEFTATAGRPRDGRIIFVSPTISPETRTAKIRVALSNGNLMLKPGMYATIIVHGVARAGVLQVPRSAVLATGERTLVFVKAADGMLYPRPVELGQVTDDRVEVRRGVVAGETVVSSATFLIDAESNLGAALGAMANMPGMDMSAPAKGAAPKAAPSPTPPAHDMTTMDKPAAPTPVTKTPVKPKAGKAPAPMPDMPGMDHSQHKP